MIAQAQNMLPPMPTRGEIAAFMNSSTFREKKVTVRQVRCWEEAGYIARHPAYIKPARYKARSVLDFIEGNISVNGRPL